MTMFWVGAMFVATPLLFAGIVLGVWWHGRKRQEQATAGRHTPPNSGPPSGR